MHEARGYHIMVIITIIRFRGCVSRNRIALTYALMYEYCMGKRVFEYYRRYIRMTDPPLYR